MALRPARLIGLRKLARVKRRYVSSPLRPLLLPTPTVHLLHWLVNPEKDVREVMCRDN
jgi:hypothetical protein